MKNQWYHIQRTADRAHVRLVGLIGFFGAKADEFLAELGDTRKVDLFVDSMGGSILDAQRIYEALRERETVATVARAWSAACFLTMAAREISILRKGTMMVHYAQAGVLGGPPELRKMADDLESYSVPMIEAFAARTGKPANVIKGWLGGNRFFSAKEAVRNKLADRILATGRAASDDNEDSSSASSSPVPTVDESEELALDLLRALPPIKTADKRRFARNLSQWLNTHVTEI